MTTQYYGLARGAQDGAAAAVTTATATTSKALEVAVDLSSAYTRAEVLRGLEKIKQFILNERATPFAQ